MRTTSPCRVIAAAVFAGVSAAAMAQPASGTITGTAMGHGSQQMHEQMMGGMQKMQSMQPSGDTDKDFAMMMRAHHQQALDMAKAELEHGRSTELKAMARKIIDGQTKEIAQFDKWLANHK